MGKMILEWYLYSTFFCRSKRKTVQVEGSAKLV